MSTAPARSRPVAAIAILAALLVVACLLGVGVGAVPVAPSEVVRAVAGRLSGAPPSLSDAVVLDLRLPRVVLAALVGACLASAGALYQALFKNPLADPYILGVSSGAGLAATLAQALGAGGAAADIPAASFVGAMLTVLAVARIAQRGAGLKTTSLLLAGVAVSYVLAAMTSFVMVLHKETMARIVFWMMGGMTGAGWGQVAWVAPMLAIGLVIGLLQAEELDVILLGDERASQLGVRVERLKRVALASASLLVAAAVSVSGLIGFIGLMTPHAVRLVLGPRHRVLLPASALAGASALVLADAAARCVLAPVELPVGIVTALLGGPFFIWLLVKAVRP